MRRGWRRTRIARGRGQAEPGPDAARHADAAPLSPVQQVARFCLCPAAWGSDVLQHSLAAALGARSWSDREQNLCAAYEAVAGLHNELGLTNPVDRSVRPYYDRPYRVIDAGRFVASLRDSISSDEIRRLPPTGAVDQFIDSTDAAGDLRLLRAAISVQLGR